MKRHFSIPYGTLPMPRASMSANLSADNVHAGTEANTMTSYAMEQITRERIADWHRQAQRELLVRSRRAPRPWLRNKDMIAPAVPNPGLAWLASLRRLASRLVAAT
jgi:hypothetical protein